MTKILLITIVILTMLPFVNAQTTQSPYAGQESQKIKSLSDSDIQALLNGTGMGMAKAAELNNYPGPRHVLDLADKLELNNLQLKQTKIFYEQMKNSAVILGKKIVSLETQLNSYFAKNAINKRKLESLTQKIAYNQGLLRSVHLNAHMEMKRILSVEQVNKYNELRGYTQNVKSEEHIHHKNRGH